MSDLRLIIGNKTYSSWSLRGWLALKRAGVPFEEIRLPMDTPEWESRIGALSPSGRVPALWHGDLSVWDSQAIAEYILETFPGAVGWPRDVKARAFARSVSAEMHSGFGAMRSELPMNCRRTVKGVSFSKEALYDVARVKAIWRQCRETHGQGGPWLFGAFTLADVAYAPVALRFVSYGVALDPLERAYVEAVESLPEIKEWREGAKAETEVMEKYERG